MITILLFLFLAVVSASAVSPVRLQGVQYDPRRLTPYVYGWAHSSMNTVTGTNVSQMYDLSGNGWHFVNAVAGTIPGVINESNGMRSVYFDGSDDHLDSSFTLLAAPYTVIASLNQRDWRDTRPWDGKDGVHRMVLWQNAATTTPDLEISNAGTAIYLNSNATLGTLHVLTIYANTDFSTGWFQCDLTAKSTTAGIGAWSGEGGLVLGCRFNGVSCASINVASIIFYSRLLTDSEINYLQLGEARRGGIKLY